jgi:hypothetical protein
VEPYGLARLWQIARRSCGSGRFLTERRASDFSKAFNSGLRSNEQA